MDGTGPSISSYHHQSFFSSPSGWSQTIPQVKKPDVEILGWRCEASWTYCQIL
ncbi:hypothetical protein J4Q44_G00123470 [Coregonus suidteri]|uniref:Uncharacterized protein n=1 Tax=Coregonus suidteri TaxID=861788 RepID=A0AAN8M1F6_9TELE